MENFKNETVGKSTGDGGVSVIWIDYSSRGEGGDVGVMRAVLRFRGYLFGFFFLNDFRSFLTLLEHFCSFYS